MTRNIEPVSIYKDIDWAAYLDDIVRHFDDQYQEMFENELGNVANAYQIPKGFRLHARKLVIYSTDFTQLPIHQREGAPDLTQSHDLTGYNLNEADDEFTVTVLANGRVTAGGGGANKVTYVIDEGIMLMPFYELRLCNNFQAEMINFPFVFDENENLGVLIRRTSEDNTGTFYTYAVRVTVRIIGELRLKNVDKR